MYYFFAPLIAWFVAGGLKFFVNYTRFGKGAKNRIGNGGFPSNHTTIVATITMLVGFNECFDTPIFGLGVAVVMIVVIDATGLRKYVGDHAASINQLLMRNKKQHRESIGHNYLEVIGGLILGIILGFILHLSM